MTTLTRLLASSALTVVIGLPALAAAPGASGDAASCGVSACAMPLAGSGRTAQLILVDDDEDDDDDGVWFFVDEDHDESEDCDDDDDDDFGEDDEEGDDDDDDDACIGSLGNAAPAGTVAPPDNGLFGTGAPPVAVTN